MGSDVSDVLSLGTDMPSVVSSSGVCARRVKIRGQPPPGMSPRDPSSSCGVGALAGGDAPPHPSMVILSRQRQRSHQVGGWPREQERLCADVRVHVSPYCATLCCARRAYIHSHSFIFIHSHSFSCIFIHIHSHSFTFIHIHSHSFTVIHIHSQSFTFIHIHSHSFTFIHIHSQTCIFMHTLAYSCILLRSRPETAVLDKETARLCTTRVRGTCACTDCVSCMCRMRALCSAVRFVAARRCASRATLGIHSFIHSHADTRPQCLRQHRNTHT